MPEAQHSCVAWSAFGNPKWDKSPKEWQRLLDSLRSQLRAKAGSITSIQAIYVPADDLTDPAPTLIFGHLDAITVLSRGYASKAIYPAVDPFNSTSKMLDPSYLKQEHFYVATNVKQMQKRLDSQKTLKTPKFHYV